MIAKGAKKLKTYRNAPLLTDLIEHKLNDALQVGYDASKENVKTPLFYLVGKIIFDIILHRKMGSVLRMNVEALAPSVRSMYDLMQRVVRCKSMITPMTTQIERHMNKIVDYHPLAQRLQQETLKTTSQSPVLTPEVVAGVVASRIRTTSETDPTKERRCRHRTYSVLHNKRSHVTLLLSPEGDGCVKKVCESRVAPVLEHSWGSLSETKAERQYNLRDSSMVLATPWGPMWLCR